MATKINFDLTDENITKLENAGFSRWQKGNMDRLYINACNYGVEYTRYANGKVSGGTINGETFGACEARDFERTKVFIDLKDSTLYVDTRTYYEAEIEANVLTIINNALAVVEETEEAEDPATEINRTIIIERVKMTSREQADTVRPQLIAANGETKTNEILAEFAERVKTICSYIEQASSGWVAAHIDADPTEIAREVFAY